MESTSVEIGDTYGRSDFIKLIFKHRIADARFVRKVNNFVDAELSLSACFYTPRSDYSACYTIVFFEIQRLSFNTEPEVTLSNPRINDF